MKNPLEIDNYYDIPVASSNENDFLVEKPVQNDFSVKIDRWQQLEDAGELFVIFLVGLFALGCILGLVGVLIYGLYSWVVVAPQIAIPTLSVLLGIGAAAWVVAGRDLKRQAKERHETR